MAIHYPDGSMSGRLGNIVFYKVNGKTRSRLIAANFKESNKVSQLYNKLSMGVVSRFVAKNSAVINIGYQGPAKGYPVQEAISAIWKSAIVLPDIPMDAKVTKNPASYPVPTLDYSRIAISRGLISLPEFTEISLTGNTLTLSWPAAVPSRASSREDQLTGLICSEEGKSAPFYDIGKRSSGTGTIKIPGILQGRLHAWFFWCNPYKNPEPSPENVSGSVYVSL